MTGDEETIRLREEIAEQIKALQGMKEMAKIYGYDISGPLPPLRKLSSGYTSVTLQQSRPRTVQLCPLDVSLLSWTSILRET